MCGNSRDAEMFCWRQGKPEQLTLPSPPWNSRSIFEYVHYFICWKLANPWFKWLYSLLISPRLGSSKYGSLGPVHALLTRNSANSFSQLVYQLAHQSVVTIQCENVLALGGHPWCDEELACEWPSTWYLRMRSFCSGSPWFFHSSCQQHSPLSGKTTKSFIYPIFTSDIPSSCIYIQCTFYLSLSFCSRYIPITSGSSDAADEWQCDLWFKR